MLKGAKWDGKGYAHQCFYSKNEACINRSDHKNAHCMRSRLHHTRRICRLLTVQSIHRRQIAMYCLWLHLGCHGVSYTQVSAPSLVLILRQIYNPEHIESCGALIIMIVLAVWQTNKVVFWLADLCKVVWSLHSFVEQFLNPLLCLTEELWATNTSVYYTILDCIPWDFADFSNTCSMGRFWDFN